MFDKETKILISIIGGLVNMILTLIIPCLLKKNKEPLLNNINKYYNNNKHIIISSSIIVSITIYIALTLTPSIDDALSSLVEETTIQPKKCISLIGLSNMPYNRTYSVYESSSSL
jgi:hypothetical protein